MLFDIFHKLFNPHCEHCAAEIEAKLERERQERACPTCDVLRLELEKTQRRERLLLEKLMSGPAVDESAPAFDPDQKIPVIVPKSLRFRQQAAELEKQSFLAAEEIKKKRTEELESSLGVKTDASV